MVQPQIPKLKPDAQGFAVRDPLFSCSSIFSTDLRVCAVTENSFDSWPVDTGHGADNVLKNLAQEIHF